MVTKPKLESDLEKILKREFPGVVLEIHKIPLSDKLGGFLIWEKFLGHSHRQRQSMLWGVLRTNLTENEQLQLSTLFTVTQAELDSMRASE